MENDFEKVYNKYYKSVYLYVFSLAKNESIAEEVTQETFYKALKNINKYNPQYKMLTWLCEIAKNTYYSMLNHNKRYAVLGEEQKEAELDIIEKMIEGENNKDILKIIHKLDDVSKEVFILRVYGTLSFKDIGEIFQKSENWARVTYYRSKLMIRREYGEKM